jgi:DNA-binding response OmpR family regulator
VARINALIRRANLSYDADRSVLECANLKLFPDNHRAERAGQEIRLTLQEFKLLKLLMENKNKVLPRTQMLETVWGINFDTNTNIVDVYISYLRNKVDTEGQPKLIETVKGVGYAIRG